jgi:hypothetical protein
VYLDSPDREPDPNNPLEVYGYVIADNTDASTGEVNWDRVDEWRASLTPEQSAAIDRNTGIHDTPLEKEYRDVGNQLRDKGYFDMRDKAWADLQAAYPGKLDQWKSYYDWYDEELKSLTADMIAKGVPKQTARTEAESALNNYGTVKKFNEHYRTQFRHQFVVDNKDLALKAVEFGYLDPDKAERKFLRSTP